jgi:putative restriction endonuclease
MKYWWVNHKQTFNAEFNGGYIWSPKRNINGARNQTYDYLTETNIGDIIFSYADAKIKAVGLISSHHQDAPTPAEFGEKGKQWDNDGHLVNVNWVPVFNPLRPKEKINLIAPLLPEKYSPIQGNGNGNQTFYLCNISEELARLLLNLINGQNPRFEDLLIDLNQRYNVERDQINNNDIQIPNVENTERKQLVDARIGQGLFRDRVTKIETSCRVTGLANKSLLIASHIKPWKSANNIERLDGNNGLILSPHVDKLFDRGMISFKDDGTVLVANETTRTALNRWRIETTNVGGFNDKQKFYLEYHRDVLFEESRKAI